VTTQVTPPEHPTGRRPLLSAGAVMFFLSAAAAVVSLVIDLRVPESHRELIVVDPGWTAGLPGVTMAWAGAVVLAQDRRHRVGCEVLDLVSAGLSNGQIAARLFLSQKTVRNHVHAVLSKLHAADRAEAIVRGRDAGLGRG
jgi:DNA-binding CsgD family transcriptional regulator